MDSQEQQPMACPLVSVIVPCYRVAPYLRRCLESILNQRVRDIECIAVDDASPDETPGILDEVAVGDARLHVVHLPENGGVSHARNVALDMAQGQWVMFVDGDDFVTPDSIETLLGASARHSDAVVVSANVTRYSEDGATALGRQFRKTGEVAFGVFESADVFMAHQDCFNACIFKLFRRSVIGQHRFSIALAYGEDTVFCHQVLLSNRAAVVIDYDSCVYGYRQASGSCVHTATMTKRLCNLEKVIASLNALAAETAFPRVISARKSAEYLWVIRKFGCTSQIRRDAIRELMPSEFYSRELRTGLHQSRKIRHQLVLWLLEHGFFCAIRWW